MPHGEIMPDTTSWTKRYSLWTPCLMLLLSANLMAQNRPALTRDQIIEQTMHPYSGLSNPGVDASTLTGKVMCGYQGWHAAQGDALGRAQGHGADW